MLQCWPLHCPVSRGRASVVRGELGAPLVRPGFARASTPFSRARLVGLAAIDALHVHLALRGPGRPDFFVRGGAPPFWLLLLCAFPLGRRQCFPRESASLVHRRLRLCAPASPARATCRKSAIPRRSSANCTSPLPLAQGPVVRADSLLPCAARMATTLVGAGALTPPHSTPSWRSRRDLLSGSARPHRPGAWW